jgi:acyl-CoA reductase-like NAD-dependent aldehyde dehydrogenase
MNTNEIIQNNRGIIYKIASLIQEKKVDLNELMVKSVGSELTDEENEVLFYARFLYNNKLIDQFGVITKEGIECLYH